MSNNKFRLSNDGTYWVGVTNKGEEFYFNGENSEHIKEFTWYINVDGYPCCHGNLHRDKNCPIHKMVYGKYKKGNVIDHINNNPLDNRLENLREVSRAENNRNKNTNNKYGLVGLTKNNNKFASQFVINKITISSSYKEYDEAYIDNIFIQHEFGFRHNEDKFYILQDVSQERIQEVIQLIEHKLEVSIVNNRIYKPKHSNIYNISEDETFYWVEDRKGDKFKISPESLEKAKLGLWNVGKHRNKQYISGRYLNHSEKILFHRFLFDLEGEEYTEWFVDHINGDELDNRLENLIITNNEGNQINKKGKGYRLLRGVYLVEYCQYNKLINGSKTFKTEIEAIQEVERRKNLLMKNRLEFKSKKELDKYIQKEKESLYVI